jgi:predicted nucleic acid-binding protein
MGIVVDSSVLIAAERGKFDFKAYRARAGDVEVFLSVITVSELLHGVHRAQTPEQQQRRGEFVEGLVASLPVLLIDLPVARRHAELSAELSKSGKTVGPHDLLIAASALVGGHVLVTRDARSFPHIPTLQCEVV